ncbi:MAG: protein kinase [Pontiellaceae bacterium]|nr:protein kinase [Pontiellaceae bacterium]
MKEDDQNSREASTRVDELFFAALAIESDEERKAFINKACAENEAVRCELDQLFAAQENTDKWFESNSPVTCSLVSLTQDLLEWPEAAETPQPADDEVGRKIDNYTLLKKIGEGGCGNVYLAEQTKPMRRQVAFKIIKRGMDTRNVIARFEAERQALAMMEHPNIAHVLNAGETETGRPFFVMELVHGIRITSYCDENRLGIHQRLELFVQVCHAIQHAHQKGIIHRDIKPSNVLITLHDDVPVPKVIDFGIAKATSTDLLGEDAYHTATESFIGTPAYMSPEQAQMNLKNIDTRSDIYSLGVLLYELLAGSPPFDQKELVSKGIDEMRRVLCEREPRRPSAMLERMEAERLKKTAQNRAIGEQRLISALRGDLDSIVLKALEKDPERRYDTANELAADVRRHLNHEPVIARPPSRLYQFRKLVVRNKVAFSAAGAVLLALCLGLSIATWMFFKAEKARANEAVLRRQAESREKLTEAVILVNQGNYEGAARLIEEIKDPPRRPSLDGVAALRSVGEWLALQGRWRESADRFTELMEIDKLDPWGPVTLDFQACGVVLVESGNLDGYEYFREEAVARFKDEANGDAAGRILKTCLLPPMDEKTLVQLKPLGILVEQWITVQSPAVQTGWSAIPISLWKYRTGEFTTAEEYARAGLDIRDRGGKTATLQLILAMSCFRNGQEDEARRLLAEGRVLVQGKFLNGLDRGVSGAGMWYDWVFARILLREAEALIDA